MLTDFTSPWCAACTKHLNERQHRRDNRYVMENSPRVLCISINAAGILYMSKIDAIFERLEASKMLITKVNSFHHLFRRLDSLRWARGIHTSVATVVGISKYAVLGVLASCSEWCPPQSLGKPSSIRLIHS